MACCLINAVVLIVALVSLGGLAEIQVTPNPLRLVGGGTGRVDVTCRLPAATTGSVTLIRITRNTTAQPGVEQGLAAANLASSTTQGKAVLSSGGLSATMATVSGSTSEKSVTLTMTQADCQYTGVYRCSVTYNAGTEDNPMQNVLSDTQNLTVTVPPSNITISVSPDNPSYTANDTVEILCNAAIGNYQQGKEPEPEWKWEYYDNQYAAWRQYTEEGDIRTETPVPAGNCNYRQTCYLTLILSTEDSQRQYRCTVTRSGEQASEVITFGDVTSGTQTETGSQTGAAKANVTGAIVGGVIGGLVLIAIVIVLVYFLWYRKRDSGEKYTTRDAGPKPAEPPVPYPPPSGGDVSYSKSNNRFKNRETGWEHKLKNQEGLHYAELDLVRNAATDNSSVNSSAATEYASIRLF